MTPLLRSLCAVLVLLVGQAVAAETLQWSTLLVWAYFTEGVVRAASDAGFSAQLALVEVLLTVTYFGCVVCYLRPLKKLAKQGVKP